MMQLPSERTSPIDTAIVTILVTTGAGFLLKMYAQWRAGASDIRGEMTTRVRKLEETVAELQKEIGNLREERGRMAAEREALLIENATLRAQR